MTARIALLHTVPRVRDDMDARLRAVGLADLRHVVDESLLADLLSGQPPAAVAPRVAEHLAGLSDADVVVVSCSSLTPVVRELRSGMSARVVAIDEPMARAAVRFERIGVLCTTESTIAASRALLRASAEEAQREVEVTVRWVDGAFAAAAEGDRAGHDARVRAAARELAPSVEVVVLAQASLAHLREEIQAASGVLTLSSPECLLDEIVAARGPGFS